MQSGPPGRPHRPQEPRDFDPRQLAADAPHSHSNQPTGRNSPYEQRRPSREDPQSRQNGDRREPERAGAAIPGQGSRNRQSRQLEDPYGRAGSDWATNEEESACYTRKEATLTAEQE